MVPRVLAAALMLQLRLVRCSSQGQIVAQVVSWPLVKQLAEPDAGLPGQHISVQRVQDHHLMAEDVTGPSGIVVFKVPADCAIGIRPTCVPGATGGKIGRGPPTTASHQGPDVEYLQTTLPLTDSSRIDS